jgi:hypothetical protein
MLSDSHRGRFGAITSARFTGVIFVTSCVRASRNSCSKLTTNSTTRRRTLDRRRTISSHASDTCAHDMHASYISAGTIGSRSSRRQSLIRLAETCRSSISPRVPCPPSRRTLSELTVSPSPGTRKMPLARSPPGAMIPSAKNGRMMGIFAEGTVLEAGRWHPATLREWTG